MNLNYQIKAHIVMNSERYSREAMGHHLTKTMQPSLGEDKKCCDNFELVNV